MEHVRSYFLPGDVHVCSFLPIKIVVVTSLIGFVILHVSLSNHLADVYVKAIHSCLPWRFSAHLGVGAQRVEILTARAVCVRDDTQHMPAALAALNPKALSSMTIDGADRG
jgi:hypothetical protein